MFLVKAMQLAQKTSSALVERRSVEQIVLHHVPNILACGTDQKWSCLSPGREKRSFIEVRDAEHPGTRLLPISVSKNIANIGPLKEKFWHLKERWYIWGLLPDRKLAESMSSTISTIWAAKRGITCSFSNLLLKFIMDFTIATNEE